MTAITVLTTEIHLTDGLYSLNDLHQAAGAEDKHRPTFFLRLDQTQALIEEIGKCADLHIIPTKAVPGRNGGTFVCKELVYAYAMWVSPRFNLAVIRAFDALVATPALPHFIAPAQQNALQQIVARRAEESGSVRVYFWSRFNNHFQLGSYKQLPSGRFEEAVAYLETMPVKEEPKTTLPMDGPAGTRLLIRLEEGGRYSVSPLALTSVVVDLGDLIEIDEAMDAWREFSKKMELSFWRKGMAAKG